MQAKPLRRTPETRSGASQSKAKLSDRFRAYRSHHRRMAVESLRRLIATPLQSFLTCLVVAIALALPALLYLALVQFQSLGASWQAQPHISVFLKMTVSDTQALELAERLRGYPEVEAVDYVSPEQGLQEFQQYSGLGTVLDTLDENPLPGVLVVRPADATAEPAQLEVLRDRLAQEALADEVRLDMDWVRRLHQMMVIGERVVLAMAALLSLGVLLVIGNTIGLAIESRRDEIVVVKLVGGTDAFVRRPFLYTGFWYGFGGGLFAWLLLLGGINWLAGPVSRLAELYQSGFRLQGLGLTESLVILLGSGVLGLLGAALAVGKHLHAIEPN